MAIELNEHQLKAIERLRTGSILCGGVGSGKSRTALAYYFMKDCNGSCKVNGQGSYSPMKDPKNLYIITTAKKRDSFEWEKECADFAISKDPESSVQNVVLTVDSWNNIKKYVEVSNSFFVFDEQRVVGYGAWTKAFLKITRKNHWILLSATPGDQWSDYIPVFIANGFYRNKTEFTTRHCVYSTHTTYPKIERYLDEIILEAYRRKILVTLEDDRETTRHEEAVIVDYDRNAYKRVFRDRWDPYDNEPIQEVAKLFYLLRKVVNSDPSRIQKTVEILNESSTAIIFYNFTYELELLRKMCKDIGMPYSEWNGLKHEPILSGQRWVYLVQYSAGCEGWNCVTTNTMIFYSQSYSYRMTEQAMGRIDRMNTQYKDLYYYKLRSQSPIDLAINRALSRKQNFNERSFMARN